MKRVLVALLAISMAAGALTGCGSKGSEKTFTVGFDAEFPPYGYRDDSGEYVALTWIWQQKYARDRAGSW